MPPNLKYLPFFEWHFCFEQRLISVPYLHIVGSISSVDCTCLTGSPSVREKGTESEWGDWRMPRPNVIWCKSGSGDPFAAGGHTSNHPPLPKITKISLGGGGEDDEEEEERQRGGVKKAISRSHETPADSWKHSIPGTDAQNTIARKNVWCSMTLRCLFYITSS